METDSIKTNGGEVTSPKRPIPRSLDNKLKLINLEDNRQYNFLYPEEKEFLKTNKIIEAKTVDQWLTFSKNIGFFDKYMDTRRGNYQFIVITLWFIAFIMAFIIIFLAAAERDFEEYSWALITLIISLILLIPSHRKLSKFSKIYISNHLRHFFVPLLKMIKKRSGGEAQLAAELDFNEFSDHYYNHRDESVPQEITHIKVPFLDSSQFIFKIAAGGYTKWRGSRYGNKLYAIYACIIKVVFDKESYKRSDNKGPFYIQENEKKIEITANHEQHLDGEDALSFGPILDYIEAIYKLVELKPGVVIPETP